VDTRNRVACFSHLPFEQSKGAGLVLGLGAGLVAHYFTGPATCSLWKSVTLSLGLQSGVGLALSGDCGSLRRAA